jgi:CysZ protein
MVAAFLLALRQFADPQIWRILVKSMALTLLLFALLGAGGWWLAERVLARSGAGEWSQLAATVLVVLGALLLWRILAIAVLQFFADEVVAAVEARHYPAALASARKLGWREELANSARGAGRALGLNLLALPVALVLLLTGIGAPLVFWLVNAVLLGRELSDMVWLRHRHAIGAPSPVAGAERFALGGVVAALLAVPVVNLLAPVLGAAMAAHLVHRKGALANAV